MSLAYGFGKDHGCVASVIGGMSTAAKTAANLLLNTNMNWEEALSTARDAHKATNGQQLAHGEGQESQTFARADNMDTVKSQGRA